MTTERTEDGRLGVRCFLGIHRYKRLSVEQVSGEHDWYEFVWGNAVLRSRCTRCSKVKLSVVYVPRWSA